VPKKPKPPRPVVAILGNGVSIAAEPKLSMSNLTSEVKRRFDGASASGHDEVSRGLANLARRVKEGGDPATDFEAMIGPLADHRAAMEDLRGLATVIDAKDLDLREACQTVDQFVEALQRQGRGHALEIIAANSVASFDLRVKVADFVDAVVDVAAGDKVVLANLSYDSLVMASLADRHQGGFCDMAVGYGLADFVLHPDAGRITGRRIRTAADLWPTGNRAAIELVHLHGSLTWWKHPVTGEVYKFGIDELRDIEQWKAWRLGGSSWEPQVVLTNQAGKLAAVMKHPFNLAYERLRLQFSKADLWLFAGYSFRDGCLNDVARQELAARTMPPSILVVTHGDDPSEDRVKEALGFAALPKNLLPRVRIVRRGIELAPHEAEWELWQADSPSLGRRYA
jgi:hypothetical protein